MPNSFPTIQCPTGQKAHYRLGHWWNPFSDEWVGECVLTEKPRPSTQSSFAMISEKDLCAHPVTVGKPGGVLHLVNRMPLMTLGPGLLRSNGDTEQINSLLLYEPLFRLDPCTQQWTPQLAESYSWSEDHKQLTLKLRPNLHWSDGAPLTADDLVFSLKMLTDTTSAVRGAEQWRDGSGAPPTVQKLDDTTVVLTTKILKLNLLDLLNAHRVLPAHRLQAIYDKDPQKIEEGFRDETLVTSGPFRFVQRDESHLILERNPFYWKKDSAGQSLPYFDKIEMQRLQTETSAQQYLMAGAVDVYTSREINPDHYQSKGLSKVSEIYYLADVGVAQIYYFLVFNLRSGKNLPNYFFDPRFRRAVSLALNRSDYHLLQRGVVPLLGFYPPSNDLWYRKLLSEEAQVDQAKKLMQELGLQDGSAKFSIKYRADDVIRSRVSKTIRQDLQKIGVEVDVRPTEFATLLEDMGKGNFETFFSAAFMDGTDTVTPISEDILPSFGDSHYWNPSQKKPATLWEAEIDRLWGDLLQAPEESKRVALFGQISQTLAEQMPIVPLLSLEHYGFYKKDLKNVRPSPTNVELYSNVEEWYRSEP